MEKLHFASDYMEGCHPEVLEALVRTNALSTVGYGDDEFCRKAKQEILEACGCPEGEVYFLVGGTQTNATVIDAVLQLYQGVVAAPSGHVAVHEAGAIEFCGHKVLVVPGEQGKLTAGGIRQYLTDSRADGNWEHMVIPGMVYLSQPTEYGTLYSLDELTKISAVCREFQIPLYVDGARLAYALASPENDVTLKDLAALCDAFYIGGTKCGLLFGEAVVFPKKGYVPHFFTIIKQHGALLAKGRLLGVQFDALFCDSLYERIGLPAIESGAAISRRIRELGFPMPYGAPTNQLFFIADNAWIERIGQSVEYGFMEKVDDSHTLIRFATSWASTPEKTAQLLALLEKH